MGLLPSDISALQIPPAMDRRGEPSSLADTFKEADETRRADREARQHRQLEDYHISTMSAERRQSTGRMGTGASAQADQEVQARKAEERRKNDTDIRIQLAAMQLQSFESGLVTQYGENFDLDLLGELTEDGHFSEDEYARFAAIDDPEERRRAIAQAIQDKIDAGELDPADLEDHPWALEWLDKHEAARVERDREAALVKDGVLSLKEVSLDTKEVVQISDAQGDRQSVVEASYENEHHAIDMDIVPSKPLGLI